MLKTVYKGLEISRGMVMSRAASRQSDELERELIERGREIAGERRKFFEVAEDERAGVEQKDKALLRYVTFAARLLFESEGCMVSIRHEGRQPKFELMAAHDEALGIYEGMRPNDAATRVRGG